MKNIKFMFVFVSILAFFLLTAFSWMAQEDFSDLNDVLVWFAVGGGSMWLWGVILARVLENIVFWHNLKPWIKKLVPMAFAAGIGFLAEALISVDIVQYIPESVAVIVLAGINYYFSQHEYQKVKDSNYASSTRLKANGA